MNNKKDKWDLNFPKVKNVQPRTLGCKLESEQPKSVEEVANGRPIKPYPFKYDTFNSISDMEEYLKNIFLSDKSLKTLKPEWLTKNKIVHTPFNLRDDVYYTGNESISIECYEPVEYPFSCFRKGGTILNLKPGEWDEQELDDMLERFKTK